MTELQITMLLHFIGVGVLFTALLGGIILGGQYAKAADYNSKATILKAMRPIGLLSPLAILLMLATGLGNWHALAWFQEGWLHTKITLFFIAAILGTIFGIRAKKRAGLIMKLADGSAPEGTNAQVAAMDKQFKIFYIVQSILIFSILFLSVVKPGRGF
ncbi:MAG TPA: hypothetical protein VGB89_10775 [Bacteroidota bacterium]